MNRKTFISTLLAIPAAILGIKATKEKDPYPFTGNLPTDTYTTVTGNDGRYAVLVEYHDGKIEVLGDGFWIKDQFFKRSNLKAIGTAGTTQG